MYTSNHNYDIDTRPVVYFENLTPKQIEQLMRLPHTKVEQIVKGRISSESRGNTSSSPQPRQRKRIT